MEFAWRSRWAAITVVLSLGFSTVTMVAPVAAGTLVTFGDGSRGAGIAVTGDGHLVISDVAHGTVIEMNADGADQKVLASDFYYPRGVAVDGQGNIYVADEFHGRIVKMAADGSDETSIANVSYPTGVAVDGNGTVYVAYNNKHLLRMNSDGTNQEEWGSSFTYPLSVAVDGQGNVFEGDAVKSYVTELSPDGTLLHTFDYGSANAMGVAVDDAGNVLVANQGLNLVFRFQPDGTRTTLGNSYVGPSGVAVDATGQVFVVSLYDYVLHIITPQEAAATTPDAPTDVTATSGDLNQSTISWTAPLATGGIPVTSYTATDAKGNSCSTTELSCTITGINPPGSDTVTVTASNDAGTSVASAPASFSVAGLPSAPQDFTATATDGNLVLSWNPPAATYGAAITGYSVAIFSYDTFVETDVAVSSESRTYSTTVSPGSYFVGVQAEDTFGLGEYAFQFLTVPLRTPSSVVISNLPSGAAYGGSFTPVVATDGDGVGSVTVGNGSACDLAGGVVTFSRVGTCTLTPHVAQGTNYAALDGSPQSFTIAATVPSAPTILGLDRGDASATLRWAVPSSSGGSPITSYRVVAHPGVASCRTTGALTCIVAGLTPGVRYGFTVVATNVIGTSVASAPATAVAAKRIVIGKFTENSAVLIGRLKVKIRAAATAIAAHHLSTVVVTGYANPGSAPSLSINRADAVQHFLASLLVQGGMSQVAISVAGGLNTSSFTANSGADPSGNRCVVLLAS